MQAKFYLNVQTVAREYFLFHLRGCDGLATMVEKEVHPISRKIHGETESFLLRLFLLILPYWLCLFNLSRVPVPPFSFFTTSSAKLLLSLRWTVTTSFWLVYICAVSPVTSKSELSFLNPDSFPLHLHTHSLSLSQDSQLARHIQYPNSLFSSWLHLVSS